MKSVFRSVMLLLVVVLAAGAAMLAFRTSAAPAGSLVFLPVVHRDADAANPALPDLIPTYAYFNMRGYHGGCVPQYTEMVIVACMRNQGQGPAGTFKVSVGDRFGGTVPGLEPGATACVETSYAANPVTIVVDPDNAVAESDESNNTLTALIPVPTPPLLCTPTPTAAPSQTPPPQGTAPPRD